MRQITDRFHIDGERIVKTSNGQPVPTEEPLFLLRARDNLAIPLLEHYRRVCVADNCDELFLTELDATIEKFRQYRVQYYDRMKQPGVTRGR